MSNEGVRIVSTDRAAKPLGHYSQAVVHNKTVYVATQLGIDPTSSTGEVGSVAEQTERALRNVSEILSAAGSSMRQVVRVTVYVSDPAHWEEVNRVYTQVFGEHRPARGIIPSKEFHKGYQVAIDVIAAL